MSSLTNERPSRRLVLGFDGGCFTCLELARKIDERLGEKLEVQNLRDPQLEGWRKEALGEDAPWAPTLFEVEGERVRAWTGWRLGVVLARFLGPADTWTVMQALGEMKAPASVVSGPAEEAGETGVVGMSRGRFLKGIGGVATALSVFTVTGRFPSVVLAQDASSGTEAETLTSALLEMGPYVRLREDKTIAVDVESARSAGKSESSIQIALDMAELNNEILGGQSLTADSPEVTELEAKFEPMFSSVAAGQNPEAYSAQSGDVSTQAKACGGNRNDPHPCPPRRYSSRRFRSRRALGAYLRYIGFRETPGWASGYARADYTKKIYAYGCNFGAFRVQAFGYVGSAGNWRYFTQSPEPNPVLTSYRWPTWWWGSYVRWWHRNYC